MSSTSISKSEEDINSCHYLQNMHRTMFENCRSAWRRYLQLGHVISTANQIDWKCHNLVFKIPRTQWKLKIEKERQNLNTLLCILREYRPLTIYSSHLNLIVCVKSEHYSFLVTLITVHEARRGWATYITLLGEVKAIYVYHNSLQCFISSPVLVQISFVR